MKIVQALTRTQIDEARDLFREYETFLDVDLCFQSFEEELASLPGKYAPPAGALLLAVDDYQAIGCVAIRRFDDTVCEMKRLFVKPEARGTGLGRQLVQEIIRVAQDSGYSLMRLDTLERLTTAMSIYKEFGFQKTAPYYDNPLPEVVYWELVLPKKKTG